MVMDFYKCIGHEIEKQYQYMNVQQFHKVRTTIAKDSPAHLIIADIVVAACRTDGML